MTRPGASEASVWNPIASSPTGRVAIGTTPVPIETRSVATATAGEQREDVGARRPHRRRPCRSRSARPRARASTRRSIGSPSSTGIETPTRTALSGPRTTAARRSRNAATPSRWSSVVKSSAVASIVSASPRAGVPVDELLPDPNGESRVRGDPSCDRERLVEELRRAATTAWTSPISSALSASMMSAREREPARPVASDHLGAAHEPVAGLEADRRLAEREAWRGRTRSRCRRRRMISVPPPYATPLTAAMHRQLGPLDRVERVEHEPEVPPGGRDGARAPGTTRCRRRPRTRLRRR